MSDARWFEIDTAIGAAIRYFAWAKSFYAKIPGTNGIEDRHLVEMAFMHAMQSGHTSFSIYARRPRRQGPHGMRT
jgi:hypothetical protein